MLTTVLIHIALKTTYTDTEAENLISHDNQQNVTIFKTISQEFSYHNLY